MEYPCTKCKVAVWSAGRGCTSCDFCEEIKEYDTLKQAINVFGKGHQMDLAIEEMSELTKAICKNKRGRDNRRDIVEEIADVEIMLKQVKLIFRVTEKELQENKICKIKRLAETLSENNAVEPITLLQISLIKELYAKAGKDIDDVSYMNMTKDEASRFIDQLTMSE